MEFALHSVENPGDSAAICIGCYFSRRSYFPSIDDKIEILEIVISEEREK